MKSASDIMTREVITVTLETTVQQLAQLLSAHGISGAPVIDQDGKVLGVVTESDLIDQNKKVHIPTVVTILDSFFFLENPDKMEQEMRKIAGATVADIYSSPAVTVSVETPVDEIATIMSEKNVHTLPVVDDGQIKGIIGKKDIIKTIAG
ncbi:CBS domain-containing protein [Desulfoprunum benzoelyticum]|uniref:CBS domain-containing protein n=1 Tax=Desulfoprunum benzoelyticum TaxID=1506996 RepID=A0A840UNN2_9BACT|nr:CBS domain-containing protein [Desulfoprunum benzoelyticum]MBB5346436.1 CBS domain-containing protein [Desulfoprunum benzoelyticum]MBM9528566.1 CBS domain-containing protein [Desulfoprunum benzoelyticum]